jgi:type I restriction enzyme M protein
LLFRTNESAFVETKRKLLDECDLWCIVSLPGGVFSAAGAGVKTNLLFFTKGRKTEHIWYYDLSYVKVGKKTPMTLAHFGWGPRFEILENAALPATLVGEWREEQEGEAFPTFARLLAHRGTPAADSDFSWTLDFAARRAKAQAEMAPLLTEVSQLGKEALVLKERIARLKKSGVKDAELTSYRDLLLTTERKARDTQAAADTIDAACFDLKAVNPCVHLERDIRSPQEILEAIAARGRAVEAAIDRLRALMDNPSMRISEEESVQYPGLTAPCLTRKKNC